jgi:Tol biopolymer transport system component
MKFAVTAAAAVLALPVWTQTVDRAEVALQGALKKETVDGDLKGAIEAYRKVALSYRGNRAVVAKALVRVGQCYEKLGDAESRKAYEQVIREFGDQADSVATARTRLAALTPRAKPSGITLRRVFEDVSGSAIAISSDGRWLVHFRMGEYHIRDSQTGRSRQLTFREPGDEGGPDGYGGLVFSPDNRQLAYVRRNKNLFVVRVISVDGSGERTVFRNRHDVAVRGWFPGSASLLIQTKLGNLPTSLYAMSIADESTKLIKQGDGRLSGASMSPDGKLVAYWLDTNRDPWQQSMRILNMEDMTDVELPCPPSMNFWPRFVSQNKGIVFFSERRGTRDLWYQPLSAGKPSGAQELIKTNIDVPGAVVGLTKDETLYLSSKMHLHDSYMGEYDSSTGKWVRPPQRLSALSTGQTASTAFSADGQWVSYSRSPRAGSWERLSLVVQSLTAKEEREIPTDLGMIEWHCWFPNGKSLLVQGQDFSGRRFGIHRFDLTTRRSTFLRAASGGWANFPAIGQDGKTVYLPLRGARPGRIVARIVETGVERDIAVGEELSGLALSPDGRSIAFARNDGQNRILEIIGTDGSGRRELYRNQIQPDGFGGIWTPTWLQDGRFLIFNTPKAGSKWPATMQRISVEGGAPQSIGLTADGTETIGKQINWPVWHTDGRHVAFGAGIKREECYALENFLPPARAAR